MIGEVDDLVFKRSLLDDGGYSMGGLGTALVVLSAGIDRRRYLSIRGFGYGYTWEPARFCFGLSFLPIDL